MKSDYKRLFIVTMIVSGVIAVLCFVASFLLACIKIQTMGILSIFIIAWEIMVYRSYMKKGGEKLPAKLMALMAIQVLMLYIFMFFAPVGLCSEKAWQYNLQRLYVGMYPYIDGAHWIPAVEDEVQGDFRFEYMASILQGTGHYCVSFTATPEAIEKYDAFFSEQAKYTMIPTAEQVLWNLDHVVPEEYRDRFEMSGGYEDQINIYLDYGFWGSGDVPSDDMKVYVIDGVLNTNHPRSSVVIIDKGNRKIQFSQLG